MGIPRLSGLLEPYGDRVHFGCKNSPCAQHETSRMGLAGFIIDGPSLVHYVYSESLRERTAVADMLDGLTCYEDVGNAVIQFLEYLGTLQIPM